MTFDNGTERPDDYEVFHITHEVSLSLSAKDSLAAPKASQKEHAMIEKIKLATSLGGGKEMRIPLNYKIDTEVAS